MKKLLKLVCWLLILLTLILGIILHRVTYDAQEVVVPPIAQQTSYGWYLQDDSSIKRNRDILMFQGGLVDEIAYLPLAQSLAQVGYEVHVLDGWLNIPFFSRGKALDLAKTGSLNAPLLIGHSLGGVVAAGLFDQLSQVDGLVPLASYPSKNTDLSDDARQVISISASGDQVLNRKAWTRAKDRLPSQVVYLEIQGGNHSQFGQYGLQKGDSIATISANDQILQVVDLVKQYFP